jgi:S1-C subfamily serine protease
VGTGDLGLLAAIGPEMMEEESCGSDRVGRLATPIPGLRTKELVMSSTVLALCLLLALPDPQQPSSDPPTSSATGIVVAIESVMADAIAKAEPSVVAIHRDKGEKSQETQAIRGRRRPLIHSRTEQLFLPGGRIARLPDSSSMISFDFGSGVVIGDHGEILTLFHVVRGARELHVRAADRQEFEAEILAADPRSDLAVIVPVEGGGAEVPRLKPMAIGKAETLRKGTFLIALGNSFNTARDGTPSASWGILSNTARRLDMEIDENSPLRKTPRLMNYPTLLQLDAKLNQGMSGGAVINLKGELVGLTTMGASPAGFDSMAGYAVPMDKLGRRVAGTLKEGKEVEYGFLGIQADNKFTNRVFQVQPNSPAALGQLQVNDEIIAVNDLPVVDFDSLILAVNAYTAGDRIRLKIRRGDETVERTIVLAKYPVDGEVIATNRPKAWRGLRVDYTTMLNYPTNDLIIMDRSTAGVVVADVEEGSPAAAAGIKKGQLIKRVGGQNVRTPGDFAEAVAAQDGPVTLETDLGSVTVR